MNDAIEKLLSIENLMSISVIKIWLSNKGIRARGDGLAYFSDHYRAHGDRVVDLIKRIVSREGGISVNQYEYFVLFCSAYLHDIGLLVSRSGHSKHSQEIILKEYRDLSLTKIDANIIGMICAAHTAIDVLDKYPLIITVGSHSVRLRLLAAILRLADSLDIDYRRMLDPLGEERYVSNRVVGVSISNKDDFIRVFVIQDDSADDDIISYINNRLGEDIKVYNDTMYMYDEIEHKKLDIKILKFEEEF